MDLVEKGLVVQFPTVPVRREVSRDHLEHGCLTGYALPFGIIGKDSPRVPPKRHGESLLGTLCIINVNPQDGI